MRCVGTLSNWGSHRRLSPLSLGLQEKCLYLRFIWGRSRLPLRPEDFAKKHKLKRQTHSGPLRNTLPIAHTCFFSLDLPEYKTPRMMRDKILFAINNCQSIDADNTSAARAAAGTHWEESDGED